MFLLSSSTRYIENISIGEQKGWDTIFVNKKVSCNKTKYGEMRKKRFICLPFFLQNLDVSARLIFRFSFVRKSVLSSFKAVSSPWALVCVQYLCFAGQKIYLLWSSSWWSRTLIARSFFLLILRFACALYL